MNRHQHRFEEIERPIDSKFSNLIWIVLGIAISLLILGFVIGVVVILIGG